MPRLYAGHVDSRVYDGTGEGGILTLGHPGPNGPLSNSASSKASEHGETRGFSDAVTREDILEAIGKFDAGTRHDFAESLMGRPLRQTVRT